MIKSRCIRWDMAVGGGSVKDLCVACARSRMRSNCVSSSLSRDSGDDKARATPIGLSARNP